MQVCLSASERMHSAVQCGRGNSTARTQHTIVKVAVIQARLVAIARGSAECSAESRPLVEFG